MDIKPSLQFEQKHRLNMTPMLRQAIKMLKLSTEDLNQTIEEELVENPALEMEERQEYPQNEMDEEVMQQKVDKVQDENTREYFEAESAIAGSAYPFTGSGEDRKREFIENTASHDETVKGHLLRQVQLLDIEAPDLELVELLISCMDENGHLNVEAISAECDIPLEELERVLPTIQSLDPPGVGARTIQECLLIQLRIKGEYPIAERIIRDFPNELRLKRYREIEKKCRITSAKLEENLSIISHLEPYPGRQYYSGAIRYIIPDVIVKERDGVYEAISNSSSIPKLCVNHYLENLLRARGTEKGVRDWVDEKVQRARTFIHSLDRREGTLLRVSRAIVDRQLDFFRRGPMFLKPMLQRDIAREVELSDSTISRITSSKYMQTPFGVYPLKYFFSKSFRSANNEEVSAKIVKELIKEFIEAENPTHPLSDERIVNRLHGRGIKIARRTVAKFRNELKILPSHLRKSQ